METGSHATPSEDHARIHVIAQLSPVVSIGMQQNKIPMIFSLRLENATKEAWEDAEISFSFDPAFAKSDAPISISIPAEGAVECTDISVKLDEVFIVGLTERVLGSITIQCTHKGLELGRAEAEVAVLPYDECYGFHFMPELLAGFVSPNHPDIAKILYTASGLLGKWTGSPALDAYQSQDANRVRTQLAAIYGAIQQLNITYAVPPASFEQFGQRVRTADMVLCDHLGTCLDLTLLFAACLEAAGLHAILVVVKGHSFIGAWLEEQSFPETVQDDPSLLSKRIAQGINQICVVETTCTCSGNSVGFQEAEQAAKCTLSTLPFLYLVDIQRARTVGIRPLPQRVWSESGYRIVHEERDASELTLRPEEMDAAYPMASANGATLTKIDQWQRRLLDLSKRNALINLRLTRSVLPILAPRLDELEDAMSSGEDFRLLPKSAEWGIPIDEAMLYENVAGAPAVAKALKLDFASRNLRIPYTEAEVRKNIVQLYRASRVAMEENGANTLYLALGALKWFETAGSTKPRYAPIILLPVDLVRKSAQAGYVIRLRDEEPQMNVTLLEFLKQDFKIQIGGLDPLPLDEHGLDIRAILSILRHHVMHIPRWDVVESAFLGAFSFAQFIMWNDLKNRKDDLVRNKVVKSLFDGRLSYQPLDMNQLPLKEGGAFLPIPADGSQLRAIEAASEGQSFVLHGPPGTGKSQTITNMIANAVAQGKTVLFVAEKMAALSVVQKRLEAIGIGPFCLEMHSNKSRKKDVLDQLEQALAAASAGSEQEYLRAADETEDTRAELELHMRAMHTRYHFGLSLYEAINGYLRYGAAREGVLFPADAIGTLTPEKIMKWEHLVDDLIAAGRLIGHPANHPLKGIGVPVYTQQLRGQAEQALSACRSALSRLVDAYGAFFEKAAMQKGKMLEEIIGGEACARAAAGLEVIPAPWRALPDLQAHIPSLINYCELAEKSAAMRRQLSQEMDEAFLREDGEALKREWRAMTQQWVLPRMFSRSKLVKALAVHFKGGKLAADHAERLILGLSDYQATASALQGAGSALPIALTDGPDDPARRRALAEESAAALLEAKRACGIDAEAIRLASAQDERLIPTAHAFLDALEVYTAAQETVASVLRMEPEALAKDATPETWTEKMDRWAAHLPELRDYTVWLTAAELAAKAGLDPVLRAYDEGMAHEDVKSAYLQGLYKALVEWIFAGSPIANQFNGLLFSEKVERFRRMTERLIELTKQEIVRRLSTRIPDIHAMAAQSSELGALQRAIRSGGRGVAIRKLMEQLPTLLPLLCPCMLMSPLSAAQYLDPARKPFDLVIFDEASQLPTCKAVGVLARGENVVVVGDPKQMPPTSFFSSNSEDEENLELEDLESILDDCLALSMPETHLKWHYRSRHESLIAFSNREYYGNELYTFPSPNAPYSKVRLVPVDGFYDRGKTRQNQAEAEAIVAEVVRRLRGQEHPSIGVVTFSAAQQNLIDDLMQEEYLHDHLLEERALQQPEPLFIKNLENVQGDERDVILFSVGYGPDSTGQVAMNFGPLNREGGWRRLNVAVSRARDEMVIFSTLRPDQLDMSRTRAKGVANLKGFLEYAMHGAGTAPEAPSRTDAGGLAQSISEALEQAGYRARMDVGSSRFKVDIAVIDPEQEDQYLLGILLDGASYKAAQTVHDREISQMSVLSGLGWKLTRVYAIDWWEDAPREVKRILAEIARAKDTGTEPILRAKLPVQSIEGGARIATVQPAQLRAREQVPKKYAITGLPFTPMPTDDFLARPPIREITQRFEKIVENEGPIIEGLLIRRLLASFDISRSGSRIQPVLDRCLKNLACMHIRQNEETVYFPKQTAPSSYAEYRIAVDDGARRDASELPWAEIGNAARAVLRVQFGLSREDLVRETAKLLGYTRVGSGVSKAMQNGIDALIERGIAKQGDDGRVYLT